MTTVHLIEYVDLSSIKPEPGNPRTHPKKQVQQIADSIQKFNFFNPILLRAETSEIICGLGRYRAAQLLGWQTVPVIRISGLIGKSRNNVYCSAALRRFPGRSINSVVTIDVG